MNQRKIEKKNMKKTIIAIVKMMMLALLVAMGLHAATVNVSAEEEKTPEEIYADELDKLNLVAIILRLDNKPF